MSFYNGFTQVYYINSYNRVAGTSDTEFSYKLNFPANHRFNKCCVLQLSIPKSFYNFNANDSFTLRELSVDTVINIPFGNYNVNNLTTMLSQLLTNNSPHYWVYTVSYPSSTQPNTGLFTFSVTGNFGNQPSLIFDEYCWRQLGFDKDSVNEFTANSLVSENYICLSTVNRIFVKSSICNTSEGSVLQEVLQTFPDNSFIYFEQFDIQSNSKDFTNNSSQVFDFLITDGLGNHLDTNGINIQMSVLFYEKNNHSELAINDLNISNLQRLYDLENEKKKLK